MKYAESYLKKWVKFIESTNLKFFKLSFLNSSCDFNFMKGVWC